MPIEFSCPACFHSYRVKDDLAGRKIKCKECGSGIAVPEESEAVSLPPRTKSPTSSTPSKKRKKRRHKASGLTDAIGRPATVGAALLVLVGLLFFTFPMLLGILSLPLALTGIALTLWGLLKCLATAFEEDVLCGLLWIVVPFYNVYYTLTRWDAVGRYFLTFVVGIGLMWSPLYMLKLSAQRADRQAVPEEEQMAHLFAPAEPAPAEPTHAATPPSDVASTAASSTPPSASPAQAMTMRGGRGAPSDIADEAVLQGRPLARTRPPAGATFLRHDDRLSPGMPLWIQDGRLWFPGELVEAHSPVRLTVRFEGWDASRDRVVVAALVRHRDPSSTLPNALRMRLKLVEFSGTETTLEDSIEETLSTFKGFVKGSVTVKLSDRLITYATDGDSPLDSPQTATARLEQAQISTIGIGPVRDEVPREPRILVEMKVTYSGSLPMKEAAQYAMTGFDQYVPRSVVIDEGKSLLRFLAIDGVNSRDGEGTPLPELSNSLSHFQFTVGETKTRPFRSGPR